LKRLALIALLGSLVGAPLHAQEKAGKIGWTAVFGTIITYEVWALHTHHQTLSETVQHSKWGKIGVGVGLGGFTVHLFIVK
jgi:hypothetical protein